MQDSEEGLCNHVQELFRRADPTAPEAVMVSHVIQRCHPPFQLYMLGHSFPSLKKLAHFGQHTAVPSTPAIPTVAEEGGELHGGEAEAHSCLQGSWNVADVEVDAHAIWNIEAT